ncbi:MAG: DUF6702 family protein [Reichenbachiella sp.]|uniref:DUF6702 family protein n=1 Tax=Reichenbachiella sp. TaxID=2184521 RepID=UPI0029665642|nr:DUF6702 family protein [Reichenbachiella sp.]MDW3208989.1 DUF6702 family protein [Reichenbachiella sp.]
MTYLFFLLINYVSGMPLHAFHVSVCEIEYDEKQRRLEITHRIFLDDLEIALTDWSGEQVDVLNPPDFKQLDQMIGKYLTERASYSLNGKSVDVSYVGSEKEESVMYAYQVISNVKKVKSLKVTNTVLMETYDDQTNIVHMESGDQMKSLKLSGSETWGEVRFD